MTQSLDRSLIKIKNEAEDLGRRIESLIGNVERQEITLNEKSVFSNDFSKLANDVSSLNETVLNCIINDNVDLESFVIAPEKLSTIEVLNSLIVDKEKLKLVVKEEEMPMQNELDPLELFDEGDEVSRKIKDINDIVGSSLDTLKKVLRA